MDRRELHIKNEEDTHKFGKALACCLPNQAVIALNGQLGAGKTRLVQAVAEAVGIPKEHVTSPTFVLVQEYQGQHAIYHFDAYRLKDEDEFLELGAEEYYDSRGWCFIEWAEKVADVLPDDYLEIQIQIVSPEDRLFSITAFGEEPSNTLKRLSEYLDRSAQTTSQ